MRATQLSRLRLATAEPHTLMKVLDDSGLKKVEIAHCTVRVDDLKAAVAWVDARVAKDRAVAA